MEDRQDGEDPSDAPIPVWSEEEVAWVEPGDQVFSPGASSSSVAFPHFVRADLWKYAEGYRMAGERLVDSLASNRYTADVLVYPILFLYRHYLEVQLKNLLVVAQVLAGEPPAIPIHHDLMKLWLEARTRMEQALPQTIADNKVAEGYIRQCHLVDRTSYAFRYPLDTKGRPTASIPDRIDLERVRHTMRKLANFLEGTLDYLDAHCDARRDMGDQMEDSW
jgi:hypothetical protein